MIDVETALYNSVTYSFPEAQVIFANEDGPEPSGTYIYILPIVVGHVGRTRTSTLTDEDENLWIQQEYEVDVRFGFVGPDAPTLAMQFSGMLQNVAFYEEWEKNNLCLRRRGEINRVFQKRETAWTKHYTLSARFGFAVKTVQPIAVIDTIVLDGIEIP